MAEAIGFAFFVILVVGITFLVVFYILAVNKFWSKSRILQSFEFRLKPISLIIVLISTLIYFGTIIYIGENYETVDIIHIAQILGFPLTAIMGFFVIKDNTGLFRKR